MLHASIYYTQPNHFTQMTQYKIIRTLTKSRLSEAVNANLIKDQLTVCGCNKMTIRKTFVSIPCSEEMLGWWKLQQLSTAECQCIFNAIAECVNMN